MLTEYIKAAMKQASYQILEDDEGFFASIPGFDGLWAAAPTLEGCRDELEEVLEEWILLGVYLHHEMPVVDGLELRVDLQEAV